jgi:hypothetical protein
MQRILEIDRQLSTLFANFSSIAADLEMPLICALSEEHVIAQQTYPGLYRIDVATAGGPSEVAAWVDALREEWEHEDFKKSFTPNLKKKRIAQHRTLPDWMPLYLGKSKKVGTRVLEHINLDMRKTTFALKLKARPGMAKRSFRLHTLELPVQNYDVIAPALETALRNRFHPLIGKQ